jgi:ribonucleoside-diphosphate reductase alpha chain
MDKQVSRSLGVSMEDLSYEAQALLEQRYLEPGETWEQLVQRVVKHVAKGESYEYKDKVYSDIHDMVWLPNSPCLVNSGKKNGGLMACFVVGPEKDTLENHVETLGDIAAVGKRGGGCGFTGSFVRQEGAAVAGSAHGYAYGPNAWALRVSDYLDMITQGGFRKMALMYTIDANHPDLESFIDLKRAQDEKFCYNFNQSIFANDDWMIKNARVGSSGSDIFQRLVENAWRNGEPGLLFSDTINDYSPYSLCECKISATNPCGEQPLPPYGSCNLGSINVAHDYFSTKGGLFDYGRLNDVTYRVTRFLDNVGDKNVFPNDKFAAWYMQHRPIGIGIMGYADLLLRLGIRYGSKEATDIIYNIMRTISTASYHESTRLGDELGVPEHCEGTVDRRNITTVSIAPTGSIGFLAGVSHGIEPVFSPVFQRTDERGKKYVFEHPLRKEDHFMSSINDDKTKIPTWAEHVDTQSEAQKCTDSGVSKTINMMNGVTREDVASAMIYAWQKGCKGITIYRDGSRDLQVLENLEEKDSMIIDCPTGVCDIP